MGEEVLSIRNMTLVMQYAPDRNVLHADIMPIKLIFHYWTFLRDGGFS